MLKQITGPRAIRGATLFALALAFAMATARAQTAGDRDAITRTALDYIEGFYTGDAARMERSLHPDLAKRIMRINGATARLDHQDAGQLIAITRNRAGAAPPRQQKAVEVLDVFRNAATAKVVANAWVDYLHLVKWQGQWRIVNVLWEMKEGQ